MSYFHCVKLFILGIGTVHGFGPDWVDGRSIACLEWDLQRGFAQEPLGEPSNFQVVASGSQHLVWAEMHLKSSPP